MADINELYDLLRSADAAAQAGDQQAVADVQALLGELDRLQAAENSAASPALDMAAQEQPVDVGLLARIADSFTGKSRRTKEIEALPDWRESMPEFSLANGIPALKTAIGTMSTNPDETAKVIQSNFPDVQMRQDEKGNYIFKSGIDQKEYALKPGFRASDVPRAVAGALMFLPAGRATSLLGAFGANAATQAAIEASQAATGGEFNAGEVGVAGALGSLGEAAGRILGVAIPGAKRLLQGKSFIPDEIAATIPALSREVVEGDLNELVRKASSGTLGSAKYQRQLAELAKINPDALNTATELGIQLPPDVFSDNLQLRAIVGTGRAIKGSEADAAWRQSVMDTVKQADVVLDNIDALTEASVMSDKVFQTLKTQRDNLKQQTGAAYGAVDSVVPKKTIISKPIPADPALGIPASFEGPGMPNLQALLETTVENRGGVKGLTSQESSLLNMVKNDTITYDRLLLEKNDLRRALRGKQTPYSNLDQSIVEKLYNAISKDQLNAVGELAGSDVSDRLVSANLLYTKQKQLEKTLVDGFGKEFTKTIVPLFQSSIKGAAKGDVTAFNKLLSIVPENLQKEAVLSAISNSVRPTTGEFKGQFGITQFDNFWGQLTKRPVVADKIQSIIGSEAYDVLDALGRTSRLVKQSADAISQTGASNQAILRDLRVTTFTDRLTQHLASKFGQYTAAGIGGKMLGPFGFAAGLALPRLLGAPKDRVALAGKMFNSAEFQNLVLDTMTRSSPRLSAIEEFARSGQFSRFAKLTSLPSDLPSKVRYIKAALMSEQDMLLPQSAFQPDRVVAEVLPNGTVKTDPSTKFRIIQRAKGKFRLVAPDGYMTVHDSEQEAIRTATKRLRKLTNSPLQ